MTRLVPALYDIHGNPSALEAVLAEVEAAGADLVVVGGDVGPGPLLGETLDLLAGLGDRARYWLLLGPDAALRRTDYDIADAAERIRAGGAPDIDELMLRESLLEPVGAAFIARHFETVAGS